MYTDMTMILHTISFKFACYHSCSRFSRKKYSYTCHANETKLKPAIRPPSSSSSFAVYAGLLVRAKIYFLKALMCSLRLHQFSFTMPPPYFHEVKLVFANDPRTDIHAGSYIGVFNGKCRSRLVLTMRIQVV